MLVLTVLTGDGSFHESESGPRCRDSRVRWGMGMAARRNVACDQPDAFSGASTSGETPGQESGRQSGLMRLIDSISH